MTPFADAADTLSALSNQLATAVERVADALVQVDGRPGRTATGTVYATDLVLAADHAVEREDDLRVGTADGRALDARLVGRDPATDLALLRVEQLRLAPARPAASRPRVGQVVLAVGRPRRDDPMASLGIVSAVGGPLRTRGGRLERFIQTDATPYPGFSGGPLIDADGTVLGILTTGLAGGLPLAVPVELAWRVADALTRQGYVERGYLGIGSQPVRLAPGQRAGAGREAGLLVVEVAPGSPADAAGLLVGDVLIALDGQPVDDAEALLALLDGQRVGRVVALEILRGAASTTLEVRIGQRGGRAR